MTPLLRIVMIRLSRRTSILGNDPPASVGVNRSRSGRSSRRPRWPALGRTNNGDGASFARLYDTLSMRRDYPSTREIVANEAVSGAFDQIEMPENAIHVKRDIQWEQSTR